MLEVEIEEKIINASITLFTIKGKGVVFNEYFLTLRDFYMVIH